MTLWLVPPLTLALFGQAAPAADVEFGAGSAARLSYMKKSVLSWQVHPADDPNVAFRLRTEPVLRFTNPVGRSRDGTVFLWVGPDGRPEAVVQASLNRRGIWVHELSSLSTRPLHAGSDRGYAWRPTQGGVEFRPVPNAPKPAPTPEQRLGQMRALIREFTVEDDFQRESWQRLRMLPKPFARHGKPGAAAADGALFAFVLTTDPEAYLMLEAREGKDGPAWHYAFAPSTTYPLRASWKGKPVWERNLTEPDAGPNRTLYQLSYSNEKVGAAPKAP